MPPSSRHSRQKQVTGFSLSLLLHGCAGVAIALAPARILPAFDEIPEAIYLDESTEMPQGTQTHTLEPAAATAAPQIAAQTQETQTPEVKKADDISQPVAQPSTRKPPQALPTKAVQKQRKAEPTTAQNLLSADDSDTSVQEAVESARRADLAAAEESAEATKAEPVRDRDQSIDSEVMSAIAESEAESDSEQEQEPEPMQEELVDRAPLAPEPEAELESTVSASTRKAGPQSLPTSTSTSTAAAATAPSGNGNGVRRGVNEKFGIRDASELHSAPGNRAPIYPERDRLLRNEGTSIFIARVRPDGTVTDVRLEKSARSQTLDAAALEAMTKWRFLPGQEGLIRKAFTFSLGGEAEELPARLRR